MRLAMHQLPEKSGQSWARIVSDVLSPPLVWSAMMLLLGLTYTRTPLESIYWTALYSFFICIIPVAFIMFMVAIGRIGDIHMKRREERYLPFLLAIICAAIGVLILRQLQAPPVFRILSVLTLVEIILLALITLFWQISMHAMSITCAVIAVGIAVSTDSGVILVPLIVLVGAARLALKRHTPMQIFWGAMLGAMIPVFILLFFPLHWLL